MSPEFRWLTPVSSYLLLAGVLRLIWPEALTFICGILAFIFLVVTIYASPFDAIRLLVMILFPMGFVKFHSPEEMQAKSKAKSEKAKAKLKESKERPSDVLYDSARDGPPEPPTTRELKEWQDHDAKLKKWRTKNSPGFTMEDLDETPF